MRPEITRELPLVEPWLRFVKDAQTMASAGLTASGAGADTDTELRMLTYANVIGQLANLRTQAAVARGLAAGTLQVHGWYYDILTGAVEVYVAGERRFLALEVSTPELLRDSANLEPPQLPAAQRDPST